MLHGGGTPYPGVASYKNHNVGFLYNKSKMFCESLSKDFVITLEDDCFPVGDFAKNSKQLLSRMDRTTISCGSLYEHRQRDYCWCAWSWNFDFLNPEMIRKSSKPPTYAGHGFGFSVMNANYLRLNSFVESGAHVDVEFSRSAWKSGLKQAIEPVRVEHVFLQQELTNKPRKA